MSKQESMDGSPANVTVTLGDLADAGKFKDTSIDVACDRSDKVIDIRFQCGPLKIAGVNGCSIEDVIDVLVTRLEGFQGGPFRCKENQRAIINLNDAKHWLTERTRNRVAQNVEGTNAPHKS